MGKMLSIELRRAFSSAGMVIALVIGVVLAVSHFAMSILALNQAQRIADYASHFAFLSDLAPDVLWFSWMPADGSTFHGYLFILALPLIATLPHAGSYLADQSNGYLDIAFTHAERSSYYAAKWIATFLSGFAVAAIPVILDFLLFLTVYPVISPVLGGGHDPVTELTFLKGMFMASPFAWVAFTALVIALAGGLFACLGLAVTFITEYALVVHILPFLILYVGSMALSAFGFKALDIFALINPARVEAPLPVFIGEFLLLFVVSVVPFIVVSTRGGESA